MKAFFKKKEELYYTKEKCSDQQNYSGLKYAKLQYVNKILRNQSNEPKL